MTFGGWLVKYYIAADDTNNKPVRSLVKRLRTKGIHCVNECKVMDESLDEPVELHMESTEVSLIEEADFILVYLTAGKGSLYNIGFALALKKKILVYTPEKDHYHIGKKSIFYNLPSVNICSGTFYKLEKAIKLMFVEQNESHDSLQLSNK